MERIAYGSALTIDMTHCEPTPSAEAGSATATADLDAAEQLLAATFRARVGSAAGEFAPAMGSIHLRRAWLTLFEQRGEVGSAECLEWALAEAKGRLTGDAQARAEAIIRYVLGDPSDRPRSLLTREAWLEHVDWVRELTPAAPRVRDGSVGIGLTLVAAVLLCMLGAALFSVLIGLGGPWRGEYFENRDFKGDSREHSVRKIEFDFADLPPLRGLGKDEWSVHWDTCITLDADTKARFKMSSDDGSRLYVDGELVVDNWGAHATRTRSGRIELAAGVHHLQVDFFEASHSANIALLAAFDDEELKTISPEMLHAPGDDPDDPDDPCGS